MINLISNNNKAANAPDHPLYNMMCIRVAYTHTCVRASVCGLVYICMYTYFWSSDPLSHPYSQAFTLTPYSHVSFSSSYFWSRHPVIPLHLAPLSYTYHDYHPSSVSPHITQQNTSQLTHHHINTMTSSHSPADDGRKNSTESSFYAYIYCYFYVFTQLYKSLKYCIQVLLILHVKCRYFFEERLFQSKSKQLPGMSFYTIVIYQSLMRYTYTGVCTYEYKCQGVWE